MAGKSKKRRKSGQTEGLRERLLKAGIENNSPLWKAVARGLGRPRRKAYEVNLYSLQRFASANDVVIVPGAVLAAGEVSKPITVAAMKFSGAAREKIRKAGGSCMTIEELVNKNPKGEKVKIMG